MLCTCGTDVQSNKDAAGLNEGAAALAMKAEHVFKRAESVFHDKCYVVTCVVSNILVCYVRLCFYVTPQYKLCLILSDFEIVSMTT